MKISRELKTAVIVLGGILLFIMGYSYLKSNPIFRSHRTYYAIYDHVGGLASATPVHVNGFPVGKVLSIRFLNEKGKLLVSFSVEGDFQFSKNSKAELYDTGIIGGKGLQIIPALDGAPSAMSGDTLPSSVRPGLTELVTQKLTPLQEKIERALVSTDTLLGGVNEVLDEPARKDLRSSIHDLSVTLANFRSSSETLNTLLTKNKQQLDGAITNTNRITENLAKVTDQLAQADYEKTLKNLQSVADNFNQLLAKIKNGEGTLGKLVEDKKVYDDLAGALQQLDLLLEDMRLNPKRYVHFSLFGKRAKPYESPTEPEKQENQ